LPIVDLRLLTDHFAGFARRINESQTTDFILESKTHWELPVDD